MIALELMHRLSFAWPWLGCLLLLPFIVRAMLPANGSGTGHALRVPSGSGFSGLGGGSDGVSAMQMLRWLLVSLAWLALIVAVMRPQLLAEGISTPVTGRNLMLAVDLSGSMETRDFELAGRTVDRLTVTKAVGGDFIERREGDRLGLILFGERAYLQTPLTFDRSTVKTLLYESAIGLAGQKTAIGDAIAVAVKRVREGGGNSKEQVLVLLTDGANTAGSVEPLKAAELAATVGLKIYTIGIGSEQITGVGGFFRSRRSPSSDLDERNLKAIAAQTGGRYFRARDTASLAEIYQELDALEPVADEESGYRPRDEVFYLPAAIAAALFALLGVSTWLGRWQRR